MFELHLATAERVSDRRAQANAWMLSVNSAVVALYGYLQTDRLAVPGGQRAVWLWAIQNHTSRPRRKSCRKQSQFIRSAV